MPSAAGKRVGRVLAGCSKPEAGDKPGSLTWQGILGSSRYTCIGQHKYRAYTCHTIGTIPCSIATLLRHHPLLEVAYTRNIGRMYTSEAYLILLNSLFLSLLT